MMVYHNIASASGGWAFVRGKATEGRPGQQVAVAGDSGDFKRRGSGARNYLGARAGSAAFAKYCFRRFAKEPGECGAEIIREFVAYLVSRLGDLATAFKQCVALRMRIS